MTDEVWQEAPLGAVVHLSIKLETETVQVYYHASVDFSIQSVLCPGKQATNKIFSVSENRMSCYSSLLTVDWIIQ